MKRIFTISIIALLTSINVISQNLPVGLTDAERAIMPFYEFPKSRNTINIPPTWSPRAMAEWEEIDALLITWTSYTNVLRQIVGAAQEECKVLIACADSNEVKDYLSLGSVPLTNVFFIKTPFNSVWIRDYGAHTIYKDTVGNNALVDWIYNRPRPNDDQMPIVHADWAGVDLYSMSNSPWNFIATGGNLMTDGFGTAMSSNLIIDENPSHNTLDINNIMNKFLGINRYILFPALPYDGIHHIDMHMKLLDEETILMGEYPDGISDGPQIEANLQWFLSIYKSCFGTPYRVVRIPMPKSPNYPYWPNDDGYYNTYTNGVFVNGTFIYPSYYEKYDTTAYRIYKETLPGYKIKPIKCYPDPISASGAIHCITNCIGVKNPLLISHQRLAETQIGTSDYKISALIKHISGISSAKVYYKTSLTGAYNSVEMTKETDDIWTAKIPNQNDGTKVYYYIQAKSVSGKNQVRPMSAPEGYWAFSCSNSVAIYDIVSKSPLWQVYPNPASQITCVPIEANKNFDAKLSIIDAIGRVVGVLHEGEISQGKSNFFFNAAGFVSGVYIIRLESAEGVSQQKVIIRGF